MHVLRRLCIHAHLRTNHVLPRGLLLRVSSSLGLVCERYRCGDQLYSLLGLRGRKGTGDGFREDVREAKTMVWVHHRFHTGKSKRYGRLESFAEFCCSRTFEGRKGSEGTMIYGKRQICKVFRLRIFSEPIRKPEPEMA